MKNVKRLRIDLYIGKEKEIWERLWSENLDIVAPVRRPDLNRPLSIAVKRSEDGSDRLFGWFCFV